ncbi:MAG TPA: dihydrofolate reductase family protein [Candidatus Dormibacteraeota bacterium]|nr:dihydrofolate reductase family protein [Candidatus Dormibacteraeota bacterium]
MSSRLFYSMSVSLDGFVATSDGSLDFVHVDDELHEVFNEEARSVGTMLLGRGMYELMAAYWPTADQDPAALPVMRDFARIWRDKPKVVFSTTLDKVDWNSRLVRDGAVEEVRRLKELPGNDMDVGGPTIAAPLIAAGLVDEFRMFVNPVVLGAGIRYFPRLNRRLKLRLLETRTYSAKVVYHRYERVEI